MIAESWVRVRPRPRFKSSCGVEFDDFFAAARAVREISQSGLYPSNCRLLDALEAGTTGAGTGEKNLMVLGFESPHLPVEEPMRLALEIARHHGGNPGDTAPPARRDSERRMPTSSPSAGRMGGGWGLARGVPARALSTRHFCRLRRPLRDFRDGDHLGPLRGVPCRDDGGGAGQGRRGLRCPGRGRGRPAVSCRFTHVYPDGPAPYFTVLAPAIRGGEVEQWDEIKAAAGEALIEGGGTITHHHAVGRDHRPWYDRQRPAPFAAALRAAKAELDPAGMLNPGVLSTPKPRATRPSDHMGWGQCVAL